MLKFIFKRTLITIPTIFILILLVFFLVHVAPGNPFQGEKALSKEVMQQLIHQYRLDLPFWKQFVFYINDLLHGNLGSSYKFIGKSINDIIFPNNFGGFWVTLHLSIYAMILVIPLGILIGCYSGVYKSTIFDRFFFTFNIVFSSIPTIVTGPILVLVFSIILKLFPSSGIGDGSLQYFVLPISALVLAYMPTIAMVTRCSIIEVLSSNFIRTAKAKGLPLRIIIFRHAIKPTLIPVVALLGTTFSGILVGSIVTEQVFALPGLGILTTNAALNRDYALILGITILGSVITIFFNLLVDIIYFILDPRIKK